MGTQGEVVVGTDMPLPFVFSVTGQVMYNLSSEADRFKFVRFDQSRSSLINKLAFDPETGLLFMVLRSDNETVYIYRTSMDGFLFFLSAPSMGVVYNRSFRTNGVGRYRADDVVSPPRLRNPIREG